MNETLQRLCADFIANRDTVKSVFKWESSYLPPICANIFCARGRVADEAVLEEARRLVKEKTGLFSNFRGNILPPVASMLAVSGRPESRMDQTLENYRILKQHFFGSEYLALVAFLLSDLTAPAQAEERAERGRAIYERMKKEHPFLTSGEDSVFAVLMAFSPMGDDALVEDMETSYQLAKKRFGHANAVQSVSHVLALAQGTPEEKTGRLFELYDALARSGRRYGTYYELATLAAVSILGADTERLAEEILEADGFLAEQKGYGGVFGLDKKTRLMHAAMIVSDEYSPRDTVDTAALAGTVAMLAAQQAAMCAVIAGSTAAHAANN